jgi:hypothetical protein
MGVDSGFDVGFGSSASGSFVTSTLSSDSPDFVSISHTTSPTFRTTPSAAPSRYTTPMVGLVNSTLVISLLTLRLLQVSHGRVSLKQDCT